MNQVQRILDGATREGRTVLLEHEAKRICDSYKIKTPRFNLAQTGAEAAQIARHLGFPVVLKIVSPDILHKSDFSCVIIGLMNSSKVKHAFQEIMHNAKHRSPNARLWGVLVEKMQPSGTEVIVGGFKDPQFGLTLMFGLGGIFVEIYEDVSFRVAPLTERSARHMIREIKGYAILRGVRSKGPADEESLVNILLASSKLMIDNPRISEIDLNPILVYEEGAITVDARMTLAA
ncbi:MAG: acetate--CoA ligase family protein [Candidatus Bathyarchaeia archaeon]